MSQQANDIISYRAWQNIALFVDDYTLLHLAQTSKILKEICNTEDVWEIRVEGNRNYPEKLLKKKKKKEKEALLALKKENAYLDDGEDDDIHSISATSSSATTRGGNRNDEEEKQQQQKEEEKEEKNDFKKEEVGFVPKSSLSVHDFSAWQNVPFSSAQQKQQKVKTIPIPEEQFTKLKFVLQETINEHLPTFHNNKLFLDDILGFIDESEFVTIFQKFDQSVLLPNFSPLEKLKVLQHFWTQRTTSSTVSRTTLQDYKTKGILEESFEEDFYGKKLKEFLRKDQKNSYLEEEEQEQQQYFRELQELSTKTQDRWRSYGQKLNSSNNIDVHGVRKRTDLKYRLLVQVLSNEDKNLQMSSIIPSIRSLKRSTEFFLYWSCCRFLYEFISSEHFPSLVRKITKNNNFLNQFVILFNEKIVSSSSFSNFSFIFKRFLQVFIEAPNGFSSSEKQQQQQTFLSRRQHILILGFAVLCRIVDMSLLNFYFNKKDSTLPPPPKTQSVFLQQNFPELQESLEKEKRNDKNKYFIFDLSRILNEFFVNTCDLTCRFVSTNDPAIRIRSALLSLPILTGLSYVLIKSNYYSNYFSPIKKIANFVLPYLQQNTNINAENAVTLKDCFLNVSSSACGKLGVLLFVFTPAVKAMRRRLARSSSNRGSKFADVFSIILSTPIALITQFSISNAMNSASIPLFSFLFSKVIFSSFVAAENSNNENNNHHNNDNNNNNNNIVTHLLTSTSVGISSVFVWSALRSGLLMFARMMQKQTRN